MRGNIWKHHRTVIARTHLHVSICCDPPQILFSLSEHGQPSTSWGLSARLAVGHVIFTVYDSPTFISSVNPFSRLLIKMLNSIMLIVRLDLEIHALSFQFRFEKYPINGHFVYFVIF